MQVARVVALATVIAVLTAYCWGNNSFGQVGNGTTADTSSPQRV